MSEADRQGLEWRVLVLPPTRKDAAMCGTVLGECGVACVVCADLPTLCGELAAGAGAAILTEESLAGEGERHLIEALGHQPPWSDLPLILLTRGGANSLVALRALEVLGNVTLLERPLPMTTLISTTKAALRARGRQYQVRDYLAERERIAAALRETDRRKDEFIAMLGHELRNPLAPIRNGVQVLRLRFGDQSTIEEIGAMMDRQVTHMARLLDDLLDVARIARGKVELRKERVKLSAVVARAVEGMTPALEERRHELEVSLPAEELWLEADLARLEQVVGNLINNACKYTEPGGHVRLTASREGSEVVVRVRDDGIGIRPEMLTRIFDMFAQADRIKGRLVEGLGLGLSLVKGLVEMHGGTVEAHSDGPGRGSEFIVRLPATSPPGGGAAAPVPVLKTEAAPLRILVVDDNVDAGNSLAGVLRLLGGHNVRVAHNGPSALAMAREFQPDAVLLDIGLPEGMDGYEVARRLRQEAGLQEALVVAVTGFGQAEDRRRSREAGFDAHLVKPVAVAAVQELLVELPRGPL